MLSDKAYEALRRACTDDDAADEIRDAIESGGNPQAANVPVFGATTNLTGVDGSGNNAADLATTESRLDAIESKINAIITALTGAGLMA